MALLLIGVVKEIVHGLSVIEQIGDLSDPRHVAGPVGRKQSGKLPKDSRLAQQVLPDVTGWREKEGRGRRSVSPGGGLFRDGCDAVFPNPLVEQRRERRDV